jgi:hypothetical protein
MRIAFAWRQPLHLSGIEHRSRARRFCSAGWKTNTSRPLTGSDLSANVRATPTPIAVCRSCPHRSATPGTREAKPSSNTLQRVRDRQHVRFRVDSVHIRPIRQGRAIRGTVEHRDDAVSADAGGHFQPGRAQLFGDQTDRLPLLTGELRAAVVGFEPTGQTFAGQTVGAIALGLALVAVGDLSIRGMGEAAIILLVIRPGGSHPPARLNRMRGSVLPGMEVLGTSPVLTAPNRA